LGFCIGNRSADVATLWSDASLEAGRLSALTQPQKELYPVLKHEKRPSAADNSKLISRLTGVTILPVQIFYG